MSRSLSLKARAVDLLSRREHSRHELARKLMRHIQPGQEAELEHLLDELQRQNWLSDERFAQSLVHRRSAKKGVAVIQQELRQHGVSQEYIAQISQQLRETEFDRCLAVWQARFGQAPADSKEYARQFRFLGSRGFAPDSIRRVIESGADGPDS